MGLGDGGHDHHTLWVMESAFVCVSGLVNVGVCAIVLHTYSTYGVVKGQPQVSVLAFYLV